jgi:hypothetical protein
LVLEAASVETSGRAWVAASASSAAIFLVEVAAVLLVASSVVVRVVAPASVAASVSAVLIIVLVASTSTIILVATSIVVSASASVVVVAASASILLCLFPILILLVVPIIVLVASSPTLVVVSSTSSASASAPTSVLVVEVLTRNSESLGILSSGVFPAFSFATLRGIGNGIKEAIALIILWGFFPILTVTRLRILFLFLGWVLMDLMRLEIKGLFQGFLQDLIWVLLELSDLPPRLLGVAFCFLFIVLLVASPLVEASALILLVASSVVPSSGLIVVPGLLLVVIPGLLLVIVPGWLLVVVPGWLLVVVPLLESPFLIIIVLLWPVVIIAPFSRLLVLIFCLDFLLFFLLRWLAGLGWLLSLLGGFGSRDDCWVQKDGVWLLDNFEVLDVIHFKSSFLDVGGGGSNLVLASPSALGAEAPDVDEGHGFVDGIDFPQNSFVPHESSGDN